MCTLNRIQWRQALVVLAVLGWITISFADTGDSEQRKAGKSFKLGKELDAITVVFRADSEVQVHPNGMPRQGILARDNVLQAKGHSQAVAPHADRKYLFKGDTEVTLDAQGHVQSGTLAKNLAVIIHGRDYPTLTFKGGSHVRFDGSGCAVAGTLATTSEIPIPGNPQPKNFGEHRTIRLPAGTTVRLDEHGHVVSAGLSADVKLMNAAGIMKTFKAGTTITFDAQGSPRG